MSGSSPEDLAIAFRSVTRRLHDAQGDAATDRTASATAELHGALADVARLMGTSPDPAAIADAVHSRPAKEWDDATLQQVRALALDVGRLLRHIAALADAD